MEKVKKIFNNVSNFIKERKKDEIIICILFVIISIFSILSFGWLGLIALPIMGGLIYVYYNPEKIARLFGKKMKKGKKKISSSKKKNTNKEKKDEFDDTIIKDEIKEELKKDEDVLVVKKKVASKKTNNRKNKNSKVKKENKRPLWKTLLTIFIIMCIAGIVSVAGFILYIVVATEEFDPTALTNKEQTVVYDKDGNIIDTLGEQKRENVTYDELPEVFIDALIATEDSRFFQHNGVDLPRFLKASFGQVLGNSDAGGASTLTMQIAKNNLTSTESSGIDGIIRKFQDIYLSVFYIEKQYTKEQIIEFYVNDNCLGGRIYGVKEAAEYYFGKSISELSLPEASLLAGLFQAPNGLNPYKNPEGASARRSTVLSLMVRHGYITEEEKELAEAVSIESMLVEATEEGDYAGYIDTVVAEVQEKTKLNPYQVSMKIYTNMDRSIQDGINDVLSGKTHTWEDEEVQAGISVVDVNTGAIVAVGAGHNRKANTFNYATQAKRHVGSTAKPIFDYGPGFEYNNFSTYTLFNDEPWAYTDGPEIGNWDGTYQGLITLRQALSVSRNVPALKAFQQVSKKNIIEFVTNLGIEAEIEGNTLHEAHALGAFNPGATTLEMASAFAAFANGGYYIEPSTVTKIEYRDTGEVVEFNNEKERVMSDSTAYLMNNVLQYAVEHGFNGGARVYGSTVAAKTGTSNLPDEKIQELGLPAGAVNDLWTVAYTPEYSIALWYGYETVTSEHYLSGASAPKDAVMQSVMKSIPKTTKEFTKPDSVVASEVEFGTWPAQLPSEYTPSDLIRTEYFKKGTQPTEVSQRFSKLNDVTNLQSEVDGRTVKLTWDFKVPEVVTESYLKTYFSQPVFGNGTNGFVQERLSYNQNTLGGLGFGIYLEDIDGTTTEVGFTTDTEYVFTVPNSYASRNATIIVKAEYKSFKANASKGVTENVTISGGSIIQSLKVDIGDSVVNSKVGEYKENAITIRYNGITIDNSKANISYKLYSSSGSQLGSYNSSSELESKVNTLAAGNYKISYIVSYKGESVIEEKTVNLHN